MKITYSLDCMYFFLNIFFSFWRHVSFDDMANNRLTRNNLKVSNTKKYA
jgi:hypothetical protein